VGPLSYLKYFFKAILGHSIIFAAIFALAVLGFSVFDWVRLGLRAMGAAWWVLLLLPTIAIIAAVRWEPHWFPDEELRKRWARSLVLGSLAVALLSSWFMPSVPPVAAASPTTPARSVVSPGGESTSPALEPAAASAPVRRPVGPRSR
jgi:hypothetical protein